MNVRKVLVLRPLDVAQLVALTFLMLAIEAGLRTTRVDRVARALGIRFLPASGDGTSARSEATGARAAPVSRPEHRWTVNAGRLSRRWPLDASCLRRSLLLGWILRRRDPVLVVGVRRSDAGIEAHAWIRLGEIDLDAAAALYEPFEVPA